MTDAREKPVTATVYALCEALKPWFEHVGALENLGNAYWMEAAASVWLQLERIEAEKGRVPVESNA